MTLEELLSQPPVDEREAEMFPLFRAALALAPQRLALRGLIPDDDAQDSEQKDSIYQLALTHTTIAEHEGALQQLGDDNLAGWGLANEYGQAAYALGVACGYVYAAGAAPKR